MGKRNIHLGQELNWKIQQLRLSVGLISWIVSFRVLRQKIARSECKVHKRLEGLSTSGDIYRSRTSKFSFRGEDIENISNSVLVGLDRCGVGLRRSSQKRGRCLTLVQCRHRIGIVAPDMVSDPVLSFSDFLLCCPAFGLGS